MRPERSRYLTTRNDYTNAYQKGAVRRQWCVTEEDGQSLAVHCVARPSGTAVKFA